MKSSESESMATYWEATPHPQSPSPAARRPLWEEVNLELGTQFLGSLGGNSQVPESPNVDRASWQNRFRLDRPRVSAFQNQRAPPLRLPDAARSPQACGSSRADPGASTARLLVETPARLLPASQKSPLLADDVARSP